MRLYQPGRFDPNRPKRAPLKPGWRVCRCCGQPTAPENMGKLNNGAYCLPCIRGASSKSRMKKKERNA